MKITIDKRKKEMIFVDSENLQRANNSEIIKLINENNYSPLNALCNIYTGYYNLNNNESIILDYLFHVDKVHSSQLLDIISESINKSKITVHRAIVNLKNKRLVCVSNDGFVKLSDKLLVDNTKIDKAKFIIIELNPSDNKPF